MATGSCTSSAGQLLHELTKSQTWVDELAYADAPIQQVRDFSMSLTHLHYADFDMRFRQALTRRWSLRLVVICQRGPAFRCRARLNVLRSLLDEDDNFPEITSLRCKFMFFLQNSRL